MIIISNMKTNLYLVASLILSISVAACSSEIDRAKFEKTRLNALAIENAIESMTDLISFGVLFDKLSDEMLSLSDIVKTEKEKQLLSEYAKLLDIYQDGYLLWEYKVESSRYAWVPEGRIYLESKIKPIALKYNFQVESHLLEITGHKWKSVSVESLKVIWEKAKEQHKKVKSI